MGHKKRKRSRMMSRHKHGQRRDKENAPAAEKERENASAEMEVFKLLKRDVKSKRSRRGNLQKEENESVGKQKMNVLTRRL